MANNAKTWLPDYFECILALLIYSSHVKKFLHKNWGIQKALHRNHFSYSLLILHTGVDLFLNGKLINLIRNIQIRLNGKKGVEPSDYIFGWMFWKRQDVILRSYFAKDLVKRCFSQIWKFMDLPGSVQPSYVTVCRLFQLWLINKNGISSSVSASWENHKQNGLQRSTSEIRKGQTQTKETIFDNLALKRSAWSLRAI